MFAEGDAVWMVENEGYNVFIASGTWVRWDVGTDGTAMAITKRAYLGREYETTFSSDVAVCGSLQEAQAEMIRRLRESQTRIEAAIGELQQMVIVIDGVEPDFVVGGGGL